MGTVTDPIKGNYNIISEPILLLKEWCKDIDITTSLSLSHRTDISPTNLQFKIFRLSIIVLTMQESIRFQYIIIVNFFCINCVFCQFATVHKSIFAKKFLTQYVSWTTVYMPTHQILSSLWLYKYVLTGCCSSVTTCKLQDLFISSKQTNLSLQQMHQTARQL